MTWCLWVTVEFFRGLYSTKASAVNVDVLIFQSRSHGALGTEGLKRPSKVNCVSSQ